MPVAYHQPVLVQEVCAALLPPLLAAEKPVLVDCTTGGAGHTAALLGGFLAHRAGLGPAEPPHPALPLRCLALDRDPEALAFARGRLSPETGGEFSAVHVELIHAPFARLAEVLDAAGIPSVTAILADLGVSSHQLDTAGRGFSFNADAPLDMRMDPGHGVPLAEALADLDVGALTRILRDFGEEPDAARIARGIAAARPRTTRELGDVVRASMSAPRLRQIGLRVHPATRTFQALRIHINGELEQLDRLLATAPQRLAVGGRLGVISFHSLEDRRVKQAFAARARAERPPPGVPILAADLPRAPFAIPAELRHGLTPGEAELAANPRSRSSRLRVLERVLP